MASKVSLMSAVLGGLAPDLTRGIRERDTESATVSPLRASERTYNVALPDGLGPVYNEEAFRYFLQLERKRCNRSQRRFLLLLVDLKQETGLSVRFDSAMDERLFSALCPCLRETDFIGWYRQRQVASAVLTQLEDKPGTHVSRLVVERVREALGQSLPSNLADRIQVRAYQVPSKDDQS
jgi:hypothetical protein